MKPVLGDWHGVLWATVRIHSGVDLKKIGLRDIRRQGDLMLVKIPEPEFLDIAVEPGTEGYLSKATAVPKLADLLKNGHRRQMEHILGQRAMEFASKEGLLPTREEILQQLNAAAAMLGSAADVKLRFE